MKRILKTALPIIVCVIISYICIHFAKTPYDEMIKPKYSPPSFIFSIAWSIIYIFFYLSLISNTDDKKIYRLYIIVLSTHILWNFTFFLLGYYLVGLIILAIIYFISWIFIFFLSKIKKKYFYMNLFYLIWLLVTLYLNIGIFQLQYI